MRRSKNPFFQSSHTALRERSTDAPPTQNAPHKLRRLRRPTGPRRAAMCAVPDQILSCHYRKDLQVAVKGLLHLAAILAPRAQDDRQKRHVERLLRTLLTHQLDWSLDDLELDSTERQIVDRLADLPAASYCMNAVHYMRSISSAGF